MKAVTNFYVFMISILIIISLFIMFIIVFARAGKNNNASYDKETGCYYFYSIKSNKIVGFKMFNKDSNKSCDKY